jgi:endonuclease G
MKKIKSVWFGLAVAAILGGLSACSAPTPAVRLAQNTSLVQREAGPGAADVKRIDENCLFGTPQKDSKWTHGPTRYIYRDGYVLEHSSLDKIPYWVCEHVTSNEVNGPLKRPEPEPFAPDPMLEGSPRAELKDYKGSGYDRGHQAPSGNQTQDARLQAETYFLSNMAPQTAALNQRIWKALEEKVRDWAMKKGEVWTITGTMFYDPDEDDPAKADGLINYYVIGPDEVAVPTDCFKIVVAPDGNGQYQAIGFVMKNQTADFPKPYRLGGYVKSIDWIEAHTGFDFLPKLDPASEEKLERKPADPAAWGLQE